MKACKIAFEDHRPVLEETRLRQGRQGDETQETQGKHVCDNGSKGDE